MTDYVAGAPSKPISSQFTTSAQAPAAGIDDERKAATEILTHNQYKTDGLDRDDLASSPLTQFRVWLQDAVEHPDIAEPEAMTISTVAVVPSASDPATMVARPSSRVVLLKRVDERGFIFFTNYDSRKGKELAANPFIALTFYWYALHRSVRVCGRVERLSRQENDPYFNSRPLGSRMGAIASPQSQTIANRSELEERVRTVEEEHKVPGAAGLDPEEQPDQYADRNIPVPDYWGGFRVIADEVEFWMGRSNRLHDRFRCVFIPQGSG